MKHTSFISILSSFIFLITLASFSPVKDSPIVQEVFSQTNQFRSSKGFTELIMLKDLNEIAQKHSEDMANGRVGFGHDGFENRNAMAAEKINPFHSFAENVAYGASSGKEVVDLWKNSQGHRRNMLGPYKYVGIGIAKDSNGRIYYTQVFAG